MRFSCDGCNAKYMISDDKVGPSGVKVRCKKCGHVTHVRRPDPEAAAASAQGGTPSVEWWVAIDEQPVGPVAIEVVQRHWDLGEIGPESLVWYSGLAEWSPIASVPELHGHLSGDKHPPVPEESPLPPPPPPPPPPDDEWRPGAASALAALEEPEPRMPASVPPAAEVPAEPPPAAPPPAEPNSVGTDPTGVRPLPMAGLERTGEKRLGTPGPRGVKVQARETAPEKESRSLTVVLLVALAVVLAVAGGLWWLTK